MTHPSNRSVALSLRLYRALARAFPDEFRNAYGDELVRVTEDAIEPIWQHHGVLGLARLLLDIAIRVPAEHLAELRQDIRYGLRMLAASPGFTAVAMASLSLGICIATCAYSEMNGLLRNLPGVPHPDQLVALEGADILSQLPELPPAGPPVFRHLCLSCPGAIRGFVRWRPLGTDLGTPGHAVVLFHPGRASVIGPFFRSGE